MVATASSVSDPARQQAFGHAALRQCVRGLDAGELAGHRDAEKVELPREWRPVRRLVPTTDRPLEVDAPRLCLGFVGTYRTLCMAPEPGFRRILEGVRHLTVAA